MIERLQELPSWQKWGAAIITIGAVVGVLYAGGQAVFAGYAHFAKSTQLRSIKYDHREDKYRDQDRYYRDEQRGVRRRNPGKQDAWPPSVREDYQQLQEDRQQNRQDWDTHRGSGPQQYRR